MEETTEATTAETTTTTEATTTTATTETPTAETTTTTESKNTDTATNTTPAETKKAEDPKPYLGETGNNEAEKKDEPKQATEEDYLKTVVKDESILGTDKDVQLDQNLIKAVIPEAQKLGVSPEALGKLANALAKAQMEEGKAALKDRIDYFNKMKAESIKKYTPQDFTQINAGIDHWFKPGGPMNGTIRNSELGADPEFLAAMHYLGSKRVMDSLQGAEASGNAPSGDPSGADGISKIW